MILWLGFALAQETPVIRPDDGRPTESIEVNRERPEQGIRKRVEPVFPESAKQNGLSYGRCIADLEVDAKGNGGKPTFVDCPEVFQKSALEALRQWRWHPDPSGDVFNTQVIIDYRDDSVTAALADPDPLETPMLEFGVINDQRPICVGHATISEDGEVLDKSANRLPDCIFEPSEDVALAKDPLPVLASCTATFVTERGYALRIKFRDCSRSVKSAAGKNLRTWTWPWKPDESTAYEMTLTFLAD